MQVEIFTHKNCTECNLLVEYLEQRGLLGKVKLIDTEAYPFLALEKGVISTPSVFVDGKMVYAGKVDFAEFEELLKGNGVERKFNRDELVTRFMEGIVDSFAATAWLYVNRDFDSFMEQKDFVFAVTGLALSEGGDEGYQYLRNVLLKDRDKILQEWEPKMFRNISSNFVREIYWLYQRKLPRDEIFSRYPLEVFAHWLMIRGGVVGRVGLRIHPLSEVETMTRIARVYGYTMENYDSIWERVEKEQKSLEKMRTIQ
ncbi:thioredoxin family protein [Metallosphaera hakonensis]|uniref:Thioredoxin n=1 Tax=Metallosphaera hakonensis JCM 8857 = DSM 7519 TaxID=1293036 RepID=A0A2U9IV17_9CREN|nr:thioredoxin family protein [Metallosphaera hakonensis]AWR99845.1 thioredoxin [Metallosphaera hakonensis JCM 8857 = DSM 7519]